ncbi:MAG: proline dehydrogenase family protein [Candidatus Marsarchaeota archaeon]|nr:proline dehydrogenase family protein [Candidatus Marsarchaeota archaeon]MCL5094834.1 proline dehydrogenase family protein [Candidatus Marsarchaeota archaeon]
MDLNAKIEKLLAGRWIAGAYIEDAIHETKKFNNLKVTAILNYLGEDFKDIENVKKSTNIYLKLIDDIKKYKLKAQISLKPTQLGLLINQKVLIQNYLKIVSNASKANIFVWLDMENSQYVDDTIKLYYKGMKYKNVGICIQSYLKRSFNDIKHIVSKQGIIRLVKGAYTEPENIAYKTRDEVTKNYVKLMKYLFINSDKFLIASHDLNMINYAESLQKKYKRDISYAMLKGIRNKYLIKLAKNNKTRVYIPFGTTWIAYSFRRLKEAGHLKLILRSLFENQKI